MAWSRAAHVLPLNQSLFHSPSHSVVSLFTTTTTTTTSSSYYHLKRKQPQVVLSPSLVSSTCSQKINHICRAAEYQFPDPIPDFAEAETEKFKTHLHAKLLKKDIYGGSVDDVLAICTEETEKFKSHLHAKLLKKDIYGGSVNDVLAICTEIFNSFLHTEYGGPGTLLVVPFIDMADTINERGLPGGPQAARSAVVWAQKHVDKDWKEWTGSED